MNMYNTIRRILKNIHIYIYIYIHSGYFFPVIKKFHRQKCETQTREPARRQKKIEKTAVIGPKAVVDRREPAFTETSASCRSVFFFCLYPLFLTNLLIEVNMIRTQLAQDIPSFLCHGFQKQIHRRQTTIPYGMALSLIKKMKITLQD